MGGRRMMIGGVAPLVLALLLGACAAGTVTPAEFERATGQTAPPPTDAPDRPAEGISGGRLPERLPEVGVERRTEQTAVATATGGEVGFGDGQAVIAAVAARAGSVEIALREAVLYPGYAIVQAVVPTRPGEIDRYTVRRNRIDGPDPERVSASDDIATSLFAPSEIPWPAIPGLVEAAKALLGVPGGEATHVIVERNHPFSPDVVLRIYVSSERASGRVEFAPDGRPLRTYRD